MDISNIQNLQYEARMVHIASHRYGGSFIKALFDALNYADHHNIAKIKATWPNEWNQYLTMAEKMSD